MVIRAEHVSVSYQMGNFKNIGLKEYIIRRLKKQYEVHEFQAVEDISFVLERGDMLGIIGSNGSGKSTLLKNVAGIMTPTKGFIEVNGKVAALLELGSGFDAEMTVRENTYLRGALLGYPKSFIDEMYPDIIEFAELENFEDFTFSQLSSGMKSRLAFAIACLVEPDILILDEVLAVGDGAFREKSGNKMREVIKSGVTTIMVSHSTNEIRNLCNKVLWLEKGEQMAFGNNVKEICDQYEAHLGGKNKKNSETEWNRRITQAIRAATEASQAIMKIYETDDFGVEMKDDNSPLTLADTASNEIICRTLCNNFPQIPILSEEATNQVSLDAPLCWVVDPLDGTKEFIGRNGQFTVNIGLVENHQVVLGIVAVPVTGEVFFARKGGGAFKRTGTGDRRIHVTDKTDELIWVGSKSHSSEKEQALIDANKNVIGDTIAAGSSLKGVMVAEGKADVYYRFGYTCEWDTCAMQCIVEEAGGIFRQMDGSEMLYNRENHLNEKGFYIVNRKENIWVPTVDANGKE